MAAAGRHRPGGMGRDPPVRNLRPAERGPQGKGRQGKGKEKGGEARLPRPGAARRGGGSAVPGAAPHGPARLCAQSAPRRGGVARGGDGQRLAAEVGGERAGCAAPCPGRALPKRRKKKKGSN